MTEDRHPLKVFLCHAHSDKTAVESLYARLTEEGFNVRHDNKLLPQEKNWEREFRGAIREMDVVVICLSKQFNKLGNTRKKIKSVLDIAHEKSNSEFSIELVKLEDCRVPNQLANYPAVDLFEFEGFAKLINVLKEREKETGLAQINNVLNPERVDLDQDAGQTGHKSKGKYRRLLMDAVGLIASVLAVITFITGRQSIAQFFQGNTDTLSSQPVRAATSFLIDSTFTATFSPEPTLSSNATSTPSLTPVVFTETVTHTPEPGYVIVDPPEVLNIAPTLRTLGQLAVEKYDLEQRNRVNNTLRFTVNSTTDVPILWRWFWCAVNDRVLEQNMTKISIIFDADGNVIPQEQLATVVFENADPTYAGWKCLTYETVMRDWKPGTYLFTQTMTISQAINDGRETFEAGYKIYEYTVHISSE